MLQFLFRASGSIVARILFGILLIAFIIFGIGDVLRSKGTAGDVATVGKQHITPDELNKALDQQARQFGGRIDKASLIKVGFLEHVLDSLIDTTLLELAAHDAGFSVGDKQAIEEIRKVPQFQDEKTGQLDREKFTRLLAANQINESEFVTYLKRETATKIMFESELAPVPVPDALVTLSYNFANETRKGELIHINNADQTVPAPTADQLADYYHKHEAEFTAPEYRDISFLYLAIGSLADKVSITPDELKQGYDARQSEFKVPERRDLSQIVFKDEGKAHAVADAANGGKTLQAAAKAAGASETVEDLGLMAQQDLPDILQGPVFAAAPGTVLPPVQTPLGWHVIMIKRAEAEHQMSFDEAKTALEADMKAEKASDLLAQTAKRIDDQLAGGASLAEAGQPYGLTPITVKGIDAQGLHADGTPATELHGRVGVLKAAFAADKDSSPQVKQDGKEADFAVTVDMITPPALRPLDEVKAKVSDGFTAQAKAAAATARATDLIAKSKAGVPFDALAQQAGSRVASIGPVPRSVKDKSLSPRVVSTLFSLTKVGQVGTATTQDGPVLVHLTDIIAAKVPGTAEKAQIERALEPQLQADLVAQYEKALREIYPVQIDQGIVDKMKSSGG